MNQDTANKIKRRIEIRVKTNIDLLIYIGFFLIEKETSI